MIQIEGGRPLVGEIKSPSSKNAALAVFSAVLVGDGISVMTNVPEIADLQIKAQLLEMFGVKIARTADGMEIDCRELRDVLPDADVVRKIRTSFYMLGPLLARNGRVTMPAPGGCNIGARPVDYHIRGLEAMGAQIDLVDGNYVAQADNLVGAKIHFDFPSAGATQHLMTTACLAEGPTVISNAATEPEVTALADFLVRMDASIEGAGTDKITINGRCRLNGAQFRIPFDRMQAGTYLMAGAMTGGEVTIKDVLPEHLSSVLMKLEEAGAEVEEGHDYVRVSGPERLKAVNVMTMPHPGFPTDLQQPVVAMLSVADGTSIVEETIYENRIGHINQLHRMGAKIELKGGNVSIITGVESLSGTSVEATDLRAGASLVLAGLAAQGETTISNVHFIDRGYENLEDNLAQLGATVRRVPLDETNSPKEALYKP